MKHDTLNDAIAMIRSYERAGKAECVVSPNSKVLRTVLRVFQKEGYIGEFELTEDGSGGSIRVKLIKKINDCGIVKPRFPVKNDQISKWEARFLPSRDFGILVVTTPEGVMSHREAKEKGLGGRILVYVY